MQAAGKGSGHICAHGVLQFPKRSKTQAVGWLSATTGAENLPDWNVPEDSYVNADRFNGTCSLSRAMDLGSWMIRRSVPTRRRHIYCPNSSPLALTVADITSARMAHRLRVLWLWKRRGERAGRRSLLSMSYELDKIDRDWFRFGIMSLMGIDTHECRSATLSIPRCCYTGTGWDEGNLPKAMIVTQRNTVRLDNRVDRGAVTRSTAA